MILPSTVDQNSLDAPIPLLGAAYKCAFHNYVCLARFLLQQLALSSLVHTTRRQYVGWNLSQLTEILGTPG